MDEIRVPVEEWTDEEWLEVIKEVPPDAPYIDGEKFVAKLRKDHARNS